MGKINSWKSLLTDTVPVNKEHLICTVPLYKEHLTGTVPVNKKHTTGALYIFWGNEGEMQYLEAIMKG